MASSQWNVYESFQALLQAGPYHFALETFLIMCIVYLLIAKKPSKGPKLTKKEEEELLADWNPEPLVLNPPDPSHPALNPRTIRSRLGHYLDLGGSQHVLNLGTHSYLNMNDRPEVEAVALSTLNKYGVGSCGPRGFYGTTEVHLEFEDRLAAFFNCEMAACYAYGFTCIASAIPAYAKNGDVIFADECVNFAIQRGLQASRSRIVYFAHNDLAHLEHLLEQQTKLDKKDPKRAQATRRFLVVEGVYLNTGKVCPLPGLVALRQKFRLRLFIDESISFGTMGQHARGITDHFNVEMKEVDMIMASTENAVASTGGFCVGTKFVVDHQRLSGVGYCFSASLPPLLVATAIKVIDILEEEGGDLVAQLQGKCREMHKALSLLPEDKLTLSGTDFTPVKHLMLSQSSGDRETNENLLREIVTKAEAMGVAVVLSTYLVDQEALPPPPSIRLTVNKDLTSEEISHAVRVLTKAAQEVLHQQGVLHAPTEEGELEILTNAEEN